MTRVRNQATRSAGAALGAAILGLSLAGCGRTEPLSWAELYASGTGESDSAETTGDGDTSTTADTTDTTTDTTTSTETDTTTDTATTSAETDTTTSTETGCSDTPVSTSQPPASVVVLVDQGGHMTQGFDLGTRWQDVGTALFDSVQPPAVAPAWEGVHDLGFTSFTSQNGGPDCPILESTPPAPDNAAAMEASYAAALPLDDAPAADALAVAGDQLAGAPGAKAVVLILGRAPDTCATPDPQQGAPEAVAAAQALFAQGVETFLVSVGNVNNNTGQPLANAGAGLDPNGPVDAPWWSPGDLPALVADLDGVLASLQGCELVLDPPIVPANADACTLSLDGVPLGLDDPEGWTVLAGDRAELLGGACQSLLQGAQVELVCTCDAF